MTAPPSSGAGIKPAIIGGAIATVVGGLAVLVASGVLFGGEHRPPSPDASPTGPYARPGEVTIDPSLPDALPLPKGIWDKVTPGWVLVDYMPVVVGSTDHPPRPILDHAKHVVYLISPDGTRYQVAEFDPYFFFTITSWTAGETVAYVNFCDNPVDCTWKDNGLLDLTTGEVLSEYDPWGGSSEAQFISTLPDGTRLWAKRGIGGAYLETGGPGYRKWTEIEDRWVAGNPVVASPDGTYLALATSGEW